MLDNGDSSDNILIREDDIVVIRPNLAGWVRNGVELILAPLTPLMNMMVYLRNMKTIAESFRDDDNFFVGGRGGYYGGGSGYGRYYGAGQGGLGTFSESNAVIVPPGGSDSAGEESGE